MSKLTAITCVAILVVVAAAGAVAYMNNNGSGDDTVVVKDMLGVEVEVKKNPDKVACVSRTTYDPLVAFGLGDRIDGGYTNVMNNPWTTILYPDSKDHYAYPYEPNQELLLERNVDLVLCPEAYISEGLREHGIPAMTVCLYGTPDFEPYVFYLSNLAKTLWPDVEGVEEKATAWENQFKNVIDDVKGTLSTKEIEEKTVYYIRGDKNKGIGYTDTKGCFNEYIFGLLGMKFLGSTFESNKPSADAILQADPDIIVIGGNHQYVLKSTLTSDSTWAPLTAVQQNKIYQIGMGFSPMEQLGAFSAIYLEDMANKLYPEYFHYDVSKDLKDLCQTYFGVTLTDTQAGYILNGLGPDGNPMA